MNDFLTKKTNHIVLEIAISFNSLMSFSVNYMEHSQLHRSLQLVFSAICISGDGDWEMSATIVVVNSVKKKPYKNREFQYLEKVFRSFEQESIMVYVIKILSS